MRISARTYYIASAVCAAAAVFAFFGLDHREAEQKTTTSRSVPTVSGQTKLKRAEEERTRLANELREAQNQERKRLEDRVAALDAELKQMRMLILSSKQSEPTLRTLSKDIAQIAGSLAGVVSVILAVIGRRRQSSA